MEKQVFFKSNGFNLFSVFYEPESFSSSLSRKAYIICHPFAEEKKSSHRILVELAHALVKKGFFVLLFDLRGCGDSEGDDSDITISAWQQDIKNAISYLKTEHLIKEEADYRTAEYIIEKAEIIPQFYKITDDEQDLGGNFITAFGRAYQ